MKTQEIAPRASYRFPVGKELFEWASFANRCADRRKLILSAAHRAGRLGTALVSRVFVKDDCTLIVHEVAGENGLPYVRTLKIWDLFEDSFTLKGGPL